MSFDLRIHFSGLMMWVPEDDIAMHVLMPSADGHGEHRNEARRAEEHEEHRGDVHGYEHDVHRARRIISRRRRERAAGETEAPHGSHHPGHAAAAVEKHHVRLVYDTAYEDPTATRLSREYMMVKLDGRVLDLTALSSPDEIDVNLPGELASLDGLGFPASRSLVHDLPKPPLAARVSMDAGVMTDYNLGTPFLLWDDRRQRITPVTEWTIRGIVSRMPAAMGGGYYLPGQLIWGPDERDEHLLPNLFPIGQTIHLMVFNMVANQYMPHHPRYRPESVGEDTHFHAYFDLLRIPEEDRPRPPRGNGRLPVPVRGDVVAKDGDEDPGSICGQTMVSLE